MEISLAAETRTGTGKGVARKLRAAGKIPAVVYGLGGNATALTVDARAMANALSTEAGHNVLIDLKVDSDTFLTLARQLQRDPLRGTITHVDFLKIDRNKTIEVDVPIHVVGNAPGVKEGGVIEHHIWEVSVSCLPMNVPERIDADVSEMQLPSHLRVEDLIKPDGVEILTNPEEMVLSVVVPQVLKLEEEVPAVEGELAEGEVPAEGEAAPAEGAPAPAEGGGEEKS